MHFCTLVLVYWMTTMYKKNLAQEWLLSSFFQILVLGWAWTSYRYQKNNLVCKLSWHRRQSTLGRSQSLQIQTHLPAFQSWYGHKCILYPLVMVLVVLMWGKIKINGKALLYFGEIALKHTNKHKSFKIWENTRNIESRPVSICKLKKIKQK